MKRLAVVLAFILPALLLGLWSVLPQADSRFAAPLFHFYIVTFTAFAATVVSLFMAISVGQTALPRHLLLAVAFAWMGAVFFIHGLTTKGALIDHFHPGITWSAWLTLFGGGGIFLLAALSPNQPDPRFLRVTGAAILFIYLAYAAVAGLAPDALTTLQALPISPQVADVIFVSTLLVWLAGGGLHWRSFRRTRNFVDGLMAFEAGWFATATVSMFRFTLWNASWWLYHGLLLLGFLVASYSLWRAYEQVRAFRLTRYYAATSLIVTAALALISAQVYATLVFQGLRDQLERDTGVLTQQISAALAANLAGVSDVESLRQLAGSDRIDELVGEQMASLDSLAAIKLYDAWGLPVYSSLPPTGEVPPPPDDLDDFHAAAMGSLAFELLEPGLAAASYSAVGSAHALETYAPFYAAGSPPEAQAIGVLATVRAAPELTRSLTTSRAAGLGLAALSLGSLFLGLLAIVNRADQLITTRTRELETAYAQLRQAEGLRDDLTRMIVHDLRNPLTAMTANLDLIGKTLNNPTYQDAPPRFLVSARSAGRRMMGMIDDLLNVGKFEAGELRPMLAPVYLPTLLREKLESFRPQAEKEDRTLSLDASPELPTVMADAALIDRVVDNLVSNAFKYTDAGGRIEIAAELNGQSVSVKVRDDGQGIPGEHHQRIFEKFVQVTDAAGVPLRKGTGLGLAFCRLAVEAHGGRIRVDSAVGRGSTFTFNLPLSSHN